MKTHFLTAILTLTATLAQAQTTVVFEEDFETNPLTNVVRVYDSSILATGETPCSEAGIGTALELNSTMVNFQSDSNSTRFLAVNPEDPCGGYYTDKVKFVSNVDLTGETEQIRLEFDYFISNTLNWGAPQLTIEIGNATETLTLDTTELSIRNQWSAFRINLPATLNHANINKIEIKLGGGSGVGLDNFRFVYGEDEDTTTEPLSVDINSINQTNVYPNPTQGILNWNGKFRSLTVYNILGKPVVNRVINNQQQIDISQLPKGMYTVRFQSAHQNRVAKVFVNPM